MEFIKQIQARELGALEELRRICLKYDLRYFLLKHKNHDCFLYPALQLRNESGFWQLKKSDFFDLTFVIFM